MPTYIASYILKSAGCKIPMSDKTMELMLYNEAPPQCSQIHLEDVKFPLSDESSSYSFKFQNTLECQSSLVYIMASSLPATTRMSLVRDLVRNETTGVVACLL